MDRNEQAKALALAGLFSALTVGGGGYLLAGWIAVVGAGTALTVAWGIAAVMWWTGRQAGRR